METKSRTKRVMNNEMLHETDAFDILHKSPVTGKFCKRKPRHSSNIVMLDRTRLLERLRFEPDCRKYCTESFWTNGTWIMVTDELVERRGNPAEDTTFDDYLWWAEDEYGSPGMYPLSINHARSVGANLDAFTVKGRFFGNCKIESASNASAPFRCFVDGMDKRIGTLIEAESKFGKRYVSVKDNATISIADAPESIVVAYNTEDGAAERAMLSGEMAGLVMVGMLISRRREGKSPYSVGFRSEAPNPKDFIAIKRAPRFVRLLNNNKE